LQTKTKIKIENNPVEQLKNNKYMSCNYESLSRQEKKSEELLAYMHSTTTRRGRNEICCFFSSFASSTFTRDCYEKEKERNLPSI